MAYPWSKDLETGNPIIDRQHRDLIDTINRLLDACAKGLGRQEIEKTLSFLNSYVTRHFNDEEKLQQQSKYPDYINHHKYHEGFKRSVAEIVADYQRDGASIVLVGKVNQVIATWLINHIKREDVKVAAHIRSMDAPAGGRRPL